MICPINSPKYNKFFGIVYKSLRQLETDGKPFVLKDFTTSIHDALLAQKKEDPQRALLYTQMIPQMIIAAYGQAPELGEYLSDNGLDLGKVAVAKKSFKDLDNVAKYLGRTASAVPTVKKAIQEKDDKVNKAPIPGKSNPVKVPENFRAMRPTMLSTTGQSAKGTTIEEIKLNIPDERALPYDNFQKEIVTDIISTGQPSNELTVTGVKNVKGIYLTAVLGGAIPDTHIHPRTKERLDNGSLKKDVYNTTPLFVITDENGDFLYFDADNKTTTKDKGKLMLYNMRSADKNRIQSAQEIAKNKAITVEAAEALIEDGIRSNEAVKAYLKVNPKAKVKTVITGGTRGFVPIDNNKPVPLSSVDFQGISHEIRVKKEPTALRPFTFLTVQGIDQPFQLNESVITPEDADLISNFITSKIYQKIAGGKEKLLTPQDKTEYLSPILWNGHIKNLLNFNDNPEAKAAAYDYLIKPFAGNVKVRTPKEGERIWNSDDTDIASAVPGQFSYIKATKDGEEGVYFLQKIFYNINDISHAKGIYDKIELKPRKSGEFNLVTDVNNPSSYTEWIKDHSNIYAQLNANNQIVSLNPSFDYEYDPKDLETVFNTKQSTEQGQAEIKAKQPVASTSPIDQPKQNNNSILDILKGDNLYKRYYQKESAIKATLAQLEDAKSWWKTSPLSKHIAFEEMFNVINTVRPDAIAQWTSHGIVLFKGSDYSDLYHEAWHGFSQLFLTKAEKTKLYNETRKIPGTFTDFNGRRVTFSKASDLQLEEFIAEEFRSFMLNDGKPVSNPVKNSIFQRILNFLKALFKGLTVSDTTLDVDSTYMKELFDKLRVGNINEFTFDMNNSSFTVLNKGIERLSANESRPENLDLTDSKLINDTVDYLISDVANQLNAGINSDSDWEKIKNKYNFIFPNLESEEFNEFRQAEGIAAPSTREYVTEGLLLKNERTRAIVYSKVLNRLVRPGGVRDSLYKDYQKEPEGPAKQRMLANLNALDYAISEFGDPNLDATVLKGKGTIAYNLKKSPFLTSSDKSEIYESLSEDEKDTGYEKQGNVMPIELMFDPILTSFLKGLYPVDKDGKPILNELGVPKPINFKFVVNRLSKVLGNGIDKDQVYKVLNERRGIEPIFNQILNRLGPLNTGNKKAHDIQTLLWRGFNLSNVNLVQLTKDEAEEEGFNTTFGIASSPTDTIRRDWEAQFSMLQNKTVKRSKEGISYLDLNSFFDLYPKWESGKELEMLHAMGIPISDDPAGIIRKRLSQKATAGYYGVGHIYNTLKAAHEIQKQGTFVRLSSINDIVGDFTKYVPQNQKTNKDLNNNEGRYSNILDLEAKYNETAGHTVSNAAGDPQQDITVPFFMTIIKDTINSVTSWDELVAVSGMGYLARNKNFLARYSRILNSIFDMRNGGNRRLDPNGIEIRKHRYIEFKLENFAGIALTEEGLPLGGMAITDLNKYDALMAYLDSFVMAGKPPGPGHGAKSTTVLYSAKTVAKKASTTHSGEQYVDIAHFIHPKDTPESTGRDLANAILIDYINGELNRIHAYNALPDRAPEKYAYKRGGEFNFFADVLSTNTKNKLIAIQEIKDNPDFTLEQYFHPDNITDEAAALYDQIITELNGYFNAQIKQVKAMFDKVTFGSDSLVNKVLSDKKFWDITYKNKERIPTAILEAFVYNTWMHSYEGRAIFYGDLAQFAKPADTGKRDGSMASPGVQFDYSESGLDFINGMGKNSRPYGYSKWNPKNETYRHAPMTEILNTAVLQDPITASDYIADNIRPAFEEELNSIKNSPLSDEEKQERVKQTIKAYEEMKIADSAGVITFDAYRILRISNGTWTDPKLEIVYQKIVNQEPVNFEDLSVIFHTLKLQYSGPLVTSSLPLMANHKFMVVPLIPTMIKGKKWEVFHNQMVDQNIDYALFQSGSKTGTITSNGKPDPFYTDVKTKEMAFNKPDYKFTKNQIYLKYLKEQTATSDEYDGKSTTSRQLRTLAISDIMNAGAPIDFMPNSSNSKRAQEWEKMKEDTKKNASPLYRLIKDYEKNLNEKTAIIKEALKKDMGWTAGDEKANMKKLLTFVHNELERKDLPEHMVDYVEYNQALKAATRQLSLSINADEIETLLTNLVSKRIVNQKSNGQSYYMVSDVGHEHISQTGTAPKTDKDIDDMIEKGEITPVGKKGKRLSYGGITYSNRETLLEHLNKDIKTEITNELPFYKRGDIDPATGKRRATSMAGARVALHGDFQKLLRLKHPDGRAIGTRERLNKLIRSESWLSQGHNRDMITIVGIRIPGQGLDSVDVVQIYEFLPIESGPVIMMHPEVVAKVGADYDNDKFPAMTPNIMVINGKVEYARNYSKAEGLDIYNKVVKARIEIEKLKDIDGIRVDIRRRRHNKGEKYESKIDLGMYNRIVERLFGLFDIADLDPDIEAELLDERAILPYDEFFKKINGVKAVENRINDNIRELALLPENYVQLVKPNGVFLLKPTTENDLKPYVADNNFNENIQEDNTGFSATRTMEIPYNLSKVTGITAAQQALGITMVGLRWSPLFNRVGFRLNPSYDVNTKKGRFIFKKQLTLHFPHNSYTTADGQKQISLSHVYNVVGDRISDLISQLSNGNVDAESDDWAANMQANREATPVILQMFKAGVDPKLVQYFVSNPLIRAYIQEQREVRGPHSRQLGKAPLDEFGNIQPNFYRAKALENILSDERYGFDLQFNIFNRPSSAPGKKLLDDKLKTLLNEKKVEFTKDKLFDAVKASSRKIIGLDYIPTDLDKAALLHYVEIEEMGKATRDITMRLTGDTKRSKNLFNAWNRKILIAELSNNKMFDYNMISKLLSDSPISSFDSNDFVMEALMPLFTLRDHPAFLKYLGQKLKTEAFNDIPSTTGDAESFGAAFINDFVGGYIFQNMLRGFNINSVKNYKGFGVNKTVEVQAVKSLKFGAFVDKGIMYVDKDTLRKDYEFSLFTNPDIYTEKRGLATIDAGAFESSDEYFHFVFEREYLRSITSSKAKELADTPMAYEEFLRDEALDNTYNIWKLFRSDKSYASQFQKIKDDNKDLVDTYPVLQALIVDAEKNSKGEVIPGGIKNIRLRTTQLTKDETDTYHEQLLKLANPATPKGSSPEENARITRFFRRMPFMAMMQSGMSTDNRFSYISIVPQKEINRLMEQESDKWIKLFNRMSEGKAPQTELDLYYEKFFESNRGSNRSKFRLKDYLLTEAQREIIKGRTETLEDTFSTLMFAVEEANLNLESDPLVKLALANPKKIFVWGAGKNVNSAVSNRTSDKVRAKDSFLKDVDNSYPLIVKASNSVGQGPALHLSDDNLEENKKIIEQNIADLKAKRDAGYTLVFNSSGYGQALIGAEDVTGDNINLAKAHAPETFRYLSKRLFEEFNFINKHLLYSKEGRAIVQQTQPVSDDAVREKLISCFS